MRIQKIHRSNAQKETIRPVDIGLLQSIKVNPPN